MVVPAAGGSLPYCFSAGVCARARRTSSAERRVPRMRRPSSFPDPPFRPASGRSPQSPCIKDAGFASLDGRRPMVGPAVPPRRLPRASRRLSSGLSARASRNAASAPHRCSPRPTRTRAASTRARGGAPARTWPAPPPGCRRRLRPAEQQERLDGPRGEPFGPARLLRPRARSRAAGGIRARSLGTRTEPTQDREWDTRDEREKRRPSPLEARRWRSGRPGAHNRGGACERHEGKHGNSQSQSTEA